MIVVKKQILLDETLYIDTLDNGLNVYLLPKKEFVDYHISLQVRIGGQTTRYRYQDQLYTIPAGTAHFLEHVFFESNDINLSDIFSEYNADINASTSRDVTNYYVSAQDHFEMVLSMFLNHFSKAKISQVTIEKERQIILKEIKMYEDNMYYRVHEDLLKQMYTDQNVWVDIAGDERSVHAINQAIIDRTIDHFYQANNMILVITGPFDPTYVKKLVRESKINLMPKKMDSPQLIFDFQGQKDHHIYQVKPNQSVTYFALGLDIDLSMLQTLSVSQRRLAIIMFFQYFFDEGSSNYQTLKDKNLINYSYNINIHVHQDYAYFTVSSETNYPKKLKSSLMDMLMNIGHIDEDKFLAGIRGRIGHFIGYFDQSNAINHALSEFVKKGYQLEKYIDHVKHMKAADVNMIKKTIKEDAIYSMTYAKK